VDLVVMVGLEVVAAEAAVVKLMQLEDREKAEMG
jgi:hypothetical protein